MPYIMTSGEDTVTAIFRRMIYDEEKYCDSYSYDAVAFHGRMRCRVDLRGVRYRIRFGSDRYG